MKLLIMVVSLVVSGNLYAREVLPLHTGWTFRNLTQDNWKPALVPGVVHLDLFRNKEIPDPFYGDNEQHLGWIAEQEWEYKTSFLITKTQIQKENLELVFAGLDTYATVYLNKNKILYCDNMFRTWRVSVKHLLREGQNELRIIFHSAVVEGKKKAALLPFAIAGDDKYNKVFTRKAQYHFGWDWGPTFITCGIWRPITLELWNTATVKNVTVSKQDITKDSAAITLQLHMLAKPHSDITITVFEQNKNKIIGKQKITLRDSTSTIPIHCTIMNPKLWWCNGLGAPHLYSLDIRLTNNKGVLLGRYTKNIGLRTIKLVQEKDSLGSSFTVELNGKPVFIKGANYIPQDSFLPRLPFLQYKQLIEDVKTSQMNMLRIWGGGIYEDDILYELCDKNGIMVWQDFMFACAMNPGDTEFLENVRQEIRDNVLRLQHHASLALWCGNNENNEGWFNWGWQKSLHYTSQDSIVVWSWYESLFHKLIPEELHKLDPTRSYIASSPLYGWGKKESMTHGDSHYWGVWWGLEPYQVYEQKVGRFMSEYGMQALPAIETLQKVIPESELIIGSKSMKNHQKHPTGFENLTQYLQRTYKAPKDFFAYGYQTQLLQKEAITLAIEAHRRAKPRCMGTLYWQLNDCWPVVSWASRDSEGRWKALQYALPKVFANIVLSVHRENNLLQPVLINDSQERCTGTVICSIKTIDGKELFTRSSKCSVDIDQNTVLEGVDVSPFLISYKNNELLCVFEFYQGEKQISQKVYLLSEPRSLSLKDPEIQVQCRYNRGATVVELTAKRFAKDVMVRGGTQETGKRWSDNFFDLLPGETKTISFPGIIKKETIQLYSLFHSY